MKSFYFCFVRHDNEIDDNFISGEVWRGGWEINGWIKMFLEGTGEKLAVKVENNKM